MHVSAGDFLHEYTFPLKQSLSWGETSTHPRNAFTEVAALPSTPGYLFDVQNAQIQGAI